MKETLKFPVSLKLEIDENGKGILSGRLKPKNSLKVWDFVMGCKHRSYIVIEKNVKSLKWKQEKKGDSSG